MKKTFVAVMITFFLAGCGPKELTPEEKQQVESLKAELSQTVSDIALSKEQGALYVGGLLKALNQAKTEVLETNKALLQQRINAIELGAKIDYSVTGVKPNLEVADAVKKEMDTLKEQISISNKEVEQYNGGLIFAIKKSEIAAKEQTLAMLQQKYLTAKYGLAEVKVLVDDTKVSNNTVTTKNNDTQTTPQALLPPVEGPMGMQVGLSKKNIEDMIGKQITEVEGKPLLYVTDSLPKNNDMFETYGLIISPKFGLCQIRAVGKDINTDSMGIALKVKFDDLKSSLDSKYGTGKKTDFLMSDSSWNEPKYWMMGLYKGERVLASSWDFKKDKIQKNALESIDIETRARDNSSGYLFLQYTFNNNASCEEEIANAKKSSL